MSSQQAFRSEVKIFVFTDGTVTLATASMRGVVATASARRAPGDKDNTDIGVDLAVARALHKLARMFEREGNGAVRHADWIRSERERRRALAAAGPQGDPADEQPDLISAKRVEITEPRIPRKGNTK